MNATISIDSELKEQAEMFLGNYGMSLSDTVTNIVSRIIGNTNRTEIIPTKENNVSAFGSLSKYANANLRKKEKDAWKIHVKEKYASFGFC